MTCQHFPCQQFVPQPITDQNVCHITLIQRLIVHSFATIAIMKQYTLSEDRVVVVKKLQGQLSVIIRQKDSDVKFAEFTPNR